MATGFAAGNLEKKCIMVLQLISLLLFVTGGAPDSIRKNSQTLSDGTQVDYMLRARWQIFSVSPPKWKIRNIPDDGSHLDIRIENEYRKKEFLSIIEPIVWNHTRDSLVMNTVPGFGLLWFKDGPAPGVMSFTIHWPKTDFFYTHPQEAIDLILKLRVQIERYVLSVAGPNVESVGFQCSSLKIKDLVKH